ncbi:uncharacterized protein LOC132061209 [Lycium ferocissimum]|uniref:uncharacterized protein LOC132061209 n=1 Tax=Lycium ferocissimum TaxID=112874 RepID=UPI0028168131|nr:uncharacterized protein LOC132061209 [Lycium ferocissimum]
MNIYMLCKVQFHGLNIPSRWHQIIQIFEGYKSTIICRVIKWMRPASGIYKCNTDGAAKGNPGPSSAAFCIRNKDGDLVYAAAKTLIDGSNIVLGRGYRMETDSMTMKMIINAEWRIPWSISMLVGDIKRLMADQRVTVEHIHREGNGLTDFLTNFVFDFAGAVQFHNFQEFPSDAKKILNLEKLGIPNLRVRALQDKAPD